MAIGPCTSRPGRRSDLTRRRYIISDGRDRFRFVLILIYAIVISVQVTPIQEVQISLVFCHDVERSPGFVRFPLNARRASASSRMLLLLFSSARRGLVNKKRMVKTKNMGFLL